MRVALGDWPPILSHTVAFILGVTLVVFTLEDQIVPINLGSGAMMFSMRAIEYPPAWDEVIARPGAAQTNVLLFQTKGKNPSCAWDQLPVTIHALGKSPILITKAKYMRRIHSMLIRSKEGSPLQLAQGDSPMLPKCEGDRIVIGD